MTKNIIIVLTTAVLSVTFAIPAAALSVSSGINSVTEGTVGVGSAAADGNAGVNVKVEESGNGNTSNAASDNTPSSGNAIAAPLLITRADIDANAVAANTETAAGVRTSDDLSGYVAAQMENDSNISSVTTGSDHVVVTYKQQAELFDFIPVTVDVTAGVSADGSVTISYPWYAFLAATNQNDLQAKIQNKVNADLGTSAGANTSTSLSVSEQAKLVSDLRAAMQDELNASSSASTSDSGNASGSI